MEQKTNRLAALIDMSDPDSVIAEIKTIVAGIDDGFDCARLDRVFADIRALFGGTYPGYRRCNTEYHNLQHTTDCLLAMTRLVHGMTLGGERFARDEIELGLLAAMFHDCGYVQDARDTTGTGAKYTSTHIDRGIEFMRRYFTEHGFPERYGRDGAAMIRCTALDTDIGGIEFSSPAVEVLGKLLGTADLLGQMADRTYLEKLLLLRYEFAEGGVPGADDETALLVRTLDFYEVTRRRVERTLDGLDRCLIHHFRGRWGIDADLYAVAIERNRDYLRYLLDNHRKEHREYLRRGNIVSKLRESGR